jgi:amino-acid N-acetyltransferase
MQNGIVLRKKKPNATSEDNIPPASIKPVQNFIPKIQKAAIRDVEEMLELINLYASSNLMLPRGPQYLYENIRDFVIAADCSAPVYSLIDSHKELHLIVACASMHVLWHDVAEIRALAIHPNYQHRGIGRNLVKVLIEEARLLGIKCLVTFTLTEGFFAKLGFIPKDRADLPSKVWGECSRCPKYFRCDEIAMALEL